MIFVGYTPHNGLQDRVAGVDQQEPQKSPLLKMRRPDGIARPAEVNVPCHCLAALGQAVP
jgi:hypothetical protein